MVEGRSRAMTWYPAFFSRSSRFIGRADTERREYDLLSRWDHSSIYGIPFGGQTPR